jgi:hypothetical protein
MEEAATFPNPVTESASFGSTTTALASFTGEASSSTTSTTTTTSDNFTTHHPAPNIPESASTATATTFA